MRAKVYRTKIQADVPTKNHGKIYSQEKLEGAIREYLDSDNHMGMLEEPGRSYEDSFEINYERICHSVENVFIDGDGYMCVEIGFLDTDCGRLAALMSDLLEISSVMIGFTGWAGDSKAVEEAAIIHFNLAWKTPV